MSKTLKNIISVFTVLCLVILIVFCVELLILNRDSSSRPEQVISANTNEPPDNDESPDVNDNQPDDVLSTVDPDDTYSENQPPNDLSPSGPLIAPPPNTERQSFMLSPNVAELVFYVDLELFERIDQGDGLYFSYIPEDYAGLELTFVFVHPQDGISALANNFLVNHIGDGRTTVMGEQAIGQSKVRGIFVTGESDVETFSAWLRSLSDFNADSLALVIKINYETEEQKDMIFNILDTMYINDLTPQETNG